MAKKNPVAKSTEVFNYIYIVTWAIMPIVYFVFKDKVQDAGLFPRHMLVGVSVLVSAAVLFAKNTKALPFRLTLGAITFFVLWHFAGYSNAIAKTEFWATFGRNGLMLSYLLLTFQLLRNQLLSFKALIKGVTLFAAISSLSLIPEFLKVLSDSSRTIYDIRGLYNHKNFAASALLLAIPFLYLGTREENKTWKLIAIATLALSILEIAFLRTRGVWIGFLGGVGATVLLQVLSKQKSNGQLKWVGIGSGVFAVLLILVFVSGNNVEKILNRDNVDVRLFYWDRCVKMAQEHPFTGVGAGNWKINFPKYGLDGTNQSVMEGETNIGRPHNDMLWILSEMGIPAWIAIAVFQLFLLFIAVKLLNHTDGEKRNYAMASIFAFVAFAAYGLGEFPMERTATVGLLVLMAAESLRLGEEEGILKRPLFTLSPTALNSTILLLAIIGLWIGNGRIKGETNARLAVDAYQTQDARGMIKYGQEAQNRFFAIDIYNSPMPYFVGLGYSASQNLQQAEKELKDALLISPYHINTIRQLADIYKFQKKYDQAIALYDQSLEISPRFYYANLSKAEIYLLTNQNIKALQALNQVSHKVTYPKYKAIGIEVLRRLGEMKNIKSHQAIVEIANKYKGNPDEMWTQYLMWKANYSSGK